MRRCRCSMRHGKHIGLTSWYSGFRPFTDRQALLEYPSQPFSARDTRASPPTLQVTVTLSTTVACFTRPAAVLFGGCVLTHLCSDSTHFGIRQTLKPNLI